MLIHRMSPAILSVVCVLLAGFGLAAPAWADSGTECRSVGGVWFCDVIAEPPSRPDSSSSGTDSPGSVKATCQFRGEQIDCTSDEGTWSNDRQCWVSLADPQPPRDSSIWEGNTSGAIYKCTPPTYSGGRLGTAWGAPTYFWSDAAPQSAAVSPAALARRAVERMELVAPTVGATPLPGDQEVSLVGLPTWLWIDGANEHSWGPITRTAAAGGVTVTAAAEATKVVWDMGDGSTVTCAGPGTPWTPNRGTGPSPTCGHRYERPSLDEPNGTFTIRATTHWQVDWAGAGQRGVITFTLTGTRDLRVTELQVLQTS